MTTVEKEERRKRTTISSYTLSQMRDAIIAGDLEPGRHYKERELCETFNASRTTVRETVQYLVSEGLLLSIPYRGVVVPRIERSAASDLYRVRSVLEGLASFEFTLHASQDQKDDLARIVGELGEISGETAAKEILMKKGAYYDCLLNGAGNKVLSEHFGLLNNRISQLRRLSLSRKGRLPKTVFELRAIIEAINEADAIRARELAEQHVMHAAAAADQQFEELERLKKHLGN